MTNLDRSVGGKKFLTQTELKKFWKYDPKLGTFTRVNENKNDLRYKKRGQNANGYRTIKVNNKSHSAHRLAFLYMTGKYPDGYVDHINRIKSDNRFDNLRVVTQSENLKNSSISVLNTSGTTGVMWHKLNNKWIAKIHVDGKDKHLGYFSDLGDAIAARKMAETKFKFHENHGSVKVSGVIYELFK